MASGILFENARIAIQKAKHGYFLLNSADTFISRSLALYGEWCESEIFLLRNVVRPGNTVVDIGANIGTHTIPFAAMVGSAGRVHAFEPQRHVFHLLCGNAALNLADNVVCHRAALGRAAGTIRVPVMPPDQPYNFGAVRLDATEGDSEEVEMRTVDSLDLPACHLIKIDVEGMEAEVLAGAAGTLARHAPFLFVECNSDDHAATVIEAIMSHGYRAWWHIAPYYNPQNHFGNAENIFERFLPERNLFCAPLKSRIKLSGLPECLGPHDTWNNALIRQQTAS